MLLAVLVPWQERIIPDLEPSDNPARRLLLSGTRDLQSREQDAILCHGSRIICGQQPLSGRASVHACHQPEESSWWRRVRLDRMPIPYDYDLAWQAGHRGVGAARRLAVILAPDPFARIGEMKEYLVVGNYWLQGLPV